MRAHVMRIINTRTNKIIVVVLYRSSPYILLQLLGQTQPYALSCQLLAHGQRAPVLTLQPLPLTLTML